MEEKRKAKRLELSGVLLMNELGGNNKESVDINIVDASTLGLGFTTSKQLMIGDNYEANLTIWTKEVIHVFLQIVRAIKQEDTYHYGAIFIGMPEDVKMRIQVYETVEEELSHQK